MSTNQARKTKLLISATAVAVLTGLTVAVAPSTASAPQPSKQQITAKKTTTTQKKTQPTKTKKTVTKTKTSTKSSSPKRKKKTSRSYDRTSASPVGRNQRIGYELASARGWDGEQWVCLKKLWIKESGWSTRSSNSSGTAWGIPQALPGSKMASEGSDWRTNPATQIRWGLKYIKGRYGSPCSAWRHFQSHNWY